VALPAIQEKPGPLENRLFFFLVLALFPPVPRGNRWNVLAPSPITCTPSRGPDCDAPSHAYISLTFRVWLVGVSGCK
jgi:hypothetical protein